MESLWGSEFDLPDSKEKTKKILEKIKKVKEVSVEKVIKSKALSIAEKLKLITENVLKILGVYKDNTVVIRSKKEFVEYIDTAIKNGYIAVDTETNNSLDPISCKLMGLCIYTPGKKNAYLPINHEELETRVKLRDQLTEAVVKEQLDRLSDTKIIMHNGKFDYQVLKCTCNCVLNVYWDTMLAARMLDENEISSGLKQQYIGKIDPSIEKYSIEHLFNGIEYAVVDPEIFALYAATDSYMTYKLYEWQVEQFNQPGMDKVLDVFLNVEMPILPVTAEMELNGVIIDSEFASLLSEKYHKELEEIKVEISKELMTLKPTVDKWRQTADANFKPKKKSNTVKVKKCTYLYKEDFVATGDMSCWYNETEGRDITRYEAIELGLDEKCLGKSKNEQLSDPINVGSPTQLAILFYDVLKVPEVYDKKTKKYTRPTGEEALKGMDYSICKLILKQREVEKLLGTYIDKLPECVNPTDGRLHASFMQLGTATGRYSSKEPNLQNIPSHNLEIRMMFKASPGYTMCGADYSQQEPRLLSHASQDDAMRGAYLNKKDIYATMGVGVYKNDYWDNMEHYEDGSPNVEGKKRRKAMKVLFLGISYGMGTPLIAERLGCSVKEAEEILDGFYQGFPKVKAWKDGIETHAKQTGYVEDLWGRRRRLPDLFLKPYDITLTKSGDCGNFNPLLGAKPLYSVKDNPLIKKYEEKIKNMKNFRDLPQIKEEAKNEGVSIFDNTNKISQAERQCVNAVIQGSAATMTKKAMISVHNDATLKELGFRLLIPVHDELIGECPTENVEKVSARLVELMVNAPGESITVPFKCDPVQMSRWYIDEMSAEIEKNYNSLVSKGMTEEEALQKVIADNSVCPAEEVIKATKGEIMNF